LDQVDRIVAGQNGRVVVDILPGAVDVLDDVLPGIVVGSGDRVRQQGRGGGAGHDHGLAAQVDRADGEGEQAIRLFPCKDLLEGIGADGKGGGAPLVTVEQVKEIFARNKLRITSDAARWLCKLCNTPDSGSVRLAKRLVEFATMVAGTKREAITSIDVDLLLLALREAISTDRADRLMDDMKSDAPPAAAKVG
jgi:hypothetical protein